uniref:Putative ixodegrin protein n=1 Tax=Ixodes ricinus TaxID=34613 RepID=A0A0K8RCA5_IXORI
MNTFIVVLVLGIVLTMFGVFADLPQETEVPASVSSGICSSQSECGVDQCCLETFSTDMALVSCAPLAEPGAPCSDRKEGTDSYKGHCPCKKGYDCVDGTCASTSQPVAVE